MPVDRHTQPVRTFFPFLRSSERMRTVPRFPVPWVRLLLRQGTHLTAALCRHTIAPPRVTRTGRRSGAMSASIRTRYLFMELPIAERTERQRNCGTTERVVVARSTNTVLPTGGKATKRKESHVEQKPSIGRVVVYNHPGDATGKFGRKQSPAIIQAVHEDGTVDLFVMTAPTWKDGVCVAGGGTYNNLRVEQGDNGLQWNWPVRV